MTKTILLNVTHPEYLSGAIEGFRFVWAFYVNGFNPNEHCQPCFKGALVSDFSTTTARNGVKIALDKMDRYPYVYVCGVGEGPKAGLGARNFHFPLAFQEGATASITTWNDYVITATNARQLPIEPLPAGWNGRDDETTRCKNFQFAVQYFGADGKSQRPTS